MGGIPSGLLKGDMRTGVATPFRGSIYDMLYDFNACIRHPKVVDGNRCFIRARAPDTWGAAFEVPLRNEYPLGGVDVWIGAPGARKSSIGIPSIMPALFDLGQISKGNLLSNALTETAFLMHDGQLIASANELLPDAATIPMF